MNEPPGFSTGSKLLRPDCLIMVACNHLAPLCSTTVPLSSAPFFGQSPPPRPPPPLGSGLQNIPDQPPQSLTNSYTSFCSATPSDDMGLEQ
eukprot:CAMPEP_0196744724 /NCGR_PEP_ID=MMETSP1091-20130531/58730_1 /TAXON_ID=302021 /ORGANISM="Rhodomonas sp., Strain CCMP768" /LENGTH=90 /DNA_ID=CAMNT_0042091341 /DNA_START=185 /DNA_END=457 /DNA_ORIENTATION=-